MIHNYLFLFTLILYFILRIIYFIMCMWSILSLVFLFIHYTRFLKLVIDCCLAHSEHYLTVGTRANMLKLSDGVHCTRPPYSVRFSIVPQYSTCTHVETSDKLSWIRTKNMSFFLPIYFHSYNLPDRRSSPQPGWGGSLFSN
jgi:hypothetical protein